MADQTTRNQKPPQEHVVLGAAEAPVVFFEVVSSYGVRHAVCRVTVEVTQPTLVDDRVERRVMAHLRFPVTTITGLRRALDQMEESLRRVSPALKN